jgi:lipopolysaccharide transport system ATP-binding protein
MGQIALSVDRIGKQYKIGVAGPRYKALRDVLAEWMPHRIRQRAKDPAASNRFWALQDVSFNVRHGEALGVIGRNGAGKSTLLKILSRITDPTTGRAEIHGRVGSLLEVGSGFHPELSGRDNIYMNGAILGMRRAEIARKFDAIVEFAEIGKFIDTPVKRYSSGMHMRLAFAVAAHLEPEILFIDEVLAVGDAAFQKKCLGKMGEVAKQGRTVLFVSHNLTAVAMLCHNAVWLHKGQVVQIGPAADVVSEYLRPENTATQFDPACYPEETNFRLLSAHLEQGENMAGPFVTSQPLDLHIHYVVHRPFPGLRVGMEVNTLEGMFLWRSFDDDMDEEIQEIRPPGYYHAVCRLPANLFYPRQYVISLAIAVQNIRWISFQKIHQTVEFYNVNGVGSRYADERHRPGALLMALDWKTWAKDESLLVSSNEIMAPPRS